MDAEQLGAKRILVAIGIGKPKVLYVHAGGQIHNAVAVLPKRGGQVFAKCLIEGLLQLRFVTAPMQIDKLHVAAGVVYELGLGGVAEQLLL